MPINREQYRQAVEFIEKHVRQPNQRQALLNDAFFPDGEALMRQIDLSADPHTFANLCAQKAYSYGCVDAEHGFARLMEALKQYMGDPTTLDGLIAAVEGDCIKRAHRNSTRWSLPRPRRPPPNIVRRADHARLAAYRAATISCPSTTAPPNNPRSPMPCTRASRW
ncbi:MAG: hypothetical protein SGI73_18270 [Chloroflexota bacterium]|nr:hypothetical protein [Chloroflexota bacterium]